ncbi:hypothetical protein OE88DRAFT_367092 [Heliocybe sulcata]|uniref:Uncharacterized protein n=1 Tax=Heliocybe sulcata TaxID=5364 RepID=A0A5C3MXP8_9AGAM|nr:hypothetical protein OE88DRAFT_367092 [Heliocybe sulcata]
MSFIYQHWLILPAWPSPRCVPAAIPRRWMGSEAVDSIQSRKRPVEFATATKVYLLSPVHLLPLTSEVQTEIVETAKDPGQPNYLVILAACLRLQMVIVPVESVLHCVSSLTCTNLPMGSGIDPSWIKYADRFPPFYKKHAPFFASLATEFNTALADAHILPLRRCSGTDMHLEFIYYA